MKKSELYRKAALAIYGNAILTPDEFIEIIHELVERANLEKFCEDQAAKKAETLELADLMVQAEKEVAV